MKKSKILSIITTVILAFAIACESEGVGGSPQNLSLTGTNYGQEVLLSWEEPVSGIPGSYIIYFREIDSTDFRTVATIDGDALEYTHDPAGMTGDYYVAVESGSTVYSSDTLTTILVHTDALLIPELNADGEYGYGWALTADFSGSTYPLTSVPNALLVDFYITNFIDDPAAGPWPGPWYIASPDTVTDDPGGYSIPQAAWRLTWFSDPLLDPQAILPNFGPTTYFKCTPGIEADTTYIGVFLDAEQHYGLVKFFGADTTTGTIQVESWFQSVPDLRLVAH
jgi:hypothetical protein